MLRRTSFCKFRVMHRHCPVDNIGRAYLSLVFVFARKETGRMRMGCRWDADGMQIGCRWDADGMQIGCRWDADWMQMGCRWDADGMQIGCRLDADWMQMTSPYCCVSLSLKIF